MNGGMLMVDSWINGESRGSGDQPLVSESEPLIISD